MKHLAVGRSVLIGGNPASIADQAGAPFVRGTKIAALSDNLVVVPSIIGGGIVNHWNRWSVEVPFLRRNGSSVFRGKR